MHNVCLCQLDRTYRHFLQNETSVLQTQMRDIYILKWVFFALEATGRLMHLKVVCYPPLKPQEEEEETRFGCTVWNWRLIAFRSVTRVLLAGTFVNINRNMEESEKSSESVSAKSNVDEVDDGSSRRNDSVKSSQSKPRLKLFSKVMEKSLQWLLDNARYQPQLSLPSLSNWCFSGLLLS